MKPYLLIISSFVLLFLSSCSRNPGKPFDPLNHDHPVELTIAVISDIHYLSPSLLKNNAASGKAFQSYLDQDPKLIEYSDPIFRQCMQQVIGERPALLIIPGDLTKDGEKVSHQELIKLLGQFDKAGIRTLVVPGNHDVNNPESVSYDGDNAKPEPSVTAAEFAKLYNGYGYGAAMSRDGESLSYITEAYPDFWVLALDANEYDDNKNIAIIGGRLKASTRKWALHWIAEAKKKHARIVGMMHHGILEHYAGQNQLDPGYVIDDYESAADEFSAAGLTMMFTGHYHANDITKTITGNKTLYDIETGSLVTAPSPFRMMRLKPDLLQIETRHVTDISVPLPGGAGFTDYSTGFLSNHLDGYIGYALANPPYSLPEDLVAVGAPLMRNAFMAHYAGDEKINAGEQAKVDAFGQLVPPLGGALKGLWTDFDPADNDINLPLP